MIPELQDIVMTGVAPLLPPLATGSHGCLSPGSIIRTKASSLPPGYQSVPQPHYSCTDFSANIRLSYKVT